MPKRFSQLSPAVSPTSSRAARSPGVPPVRSAEEAASSTKRAKAVPAATSALGAGMDGARCPTDIGHILQKSYILRGAREHAFPLRTRADQRDGHAQLALDELDVAAGGLGQFVEARCVP